MSDADAIYTGTIELFPRGQSFLRDSARNYAPHALDPLMPQPLIGKVQIRAGSTITATIRRGGHSHHQPGRMAQDVQRICGLTIDQWRKCAPFEQLSVVHPNEQLKFETPDGPMSTRIIDLLAPIGKGQRALIVAPPRTGKTVLLKQMAEGVRANHPDALLMMLLVDERPEEVTELRQVLCSAGQGWHQEKPEVVYSTNDSDAKRHARISQLMIDKTKRYVEAGRDVVILLDSLTRLGRTYNTLTGDSGRTMTGGLDIRALEIPKQIFGAARKIEGAGSLTIIASVLVETGSRMDDFIFQEFKGTGNMELVLSRELANLRIWPAIDLGQSGTRKEELLLGQEAYDKMSRLRRRIISLPPVSQMKTLLDEFGKRKNNAEYLAGLSA